MAFHDTAFETAGTGRSLFPSHLTLEGGPAMSAPSGQAGRKLLALTDLLRRMGWLLERGEVTGAEAPYVQDWRAQFSGVANRWPLRAIGDRLEAAIFARHIDVDDRRELLALRDAIAIGHIRLEAFVSDSEAIPYDDPAPPVRWTDAPFVFTGLCAYGTRQACEHAVVAQGGRCAANVTAAGGVLVVGTFGRHDWATMPSGRKVQLAVAYRDSGRPVQIIAEHHWAAALAACADEV